MAEWTLHAGQISPGRRGTRSATSLDISDRHCRSNNPQDRVSALGQKQTSARVDAMSALPPESGQSLEEHWVDSKVLSLKAVVYERGPKCDSAVLARMPLPPG